MRIVPHPTLAHIHTLSLFYRLHVRAFTCVTSDNPQTRSHDTAWIPAAATTTSAHTAALAWAPAGSWLWSSKAAVVVAERAPRYVCVCICVRWRSERARRYIGEHCENGETEREKQSQRAAVAREAATNGNTFTAAISGEPDCWRKCESIMHVRVVSIDLCVRARSYVCVCVCVCKHIMPTFVLGSKYKSKFMYRCVQNKTDFIL